MLRFHPLLVYINYEIMEVFMDVSMAHAISAFAAAVVVLGSAAGIGLIGYKAMDAIARQPEAANDIRSTMIVIAALIEGLAFFAVVVAILAIYA